MSNVQRKGSEVARNQFPELLDAAEEGKSTIITRHGRPIAVLVPIGEYRPVARQAPLIPLAGSGRGMWGKDSKHTIRRLREDH
jgi:prevent-host-death family protein